MTVSNGNPQQDKVWFITGASTGFGRLLTEHLLTLGAHVVATARKPEALGDLASPNLLVLPLDVTQPAQIASAVEQALARFGHVDVLVNNAGYGVTGAFEEVSDEELQPMFQTNVFGLIAVTRAFLPQFRARRSGHILNLSSIGGLIGGPGWGMYNATKFAVEGMSEALGGELAPLGIHVTLIEPGPFRTDFLGRSGVLAAREIPDYAPTAGKAREYLQTQHGRQPGDPQKAIEAMVTVVESTNPPRHLVLGKIALDRFRAKIKSFEDEMSTWEDVTLGADFTQ